MRKGLLAAVLALLMSSAGCAPEPPEHQLVQCDGDTMLIPRTAVEDGPVKEGRVEDTPVRRGRVGHARVFRGAGGHPHRVVAGAHADHPPSHEKDELPGAY